jgi:hypothetical protein
LQIGVEDVDLVMLVMNDRGLQHLLSSKFENSVFIFQSVPAEA